MASVGELPTSQEYWRGEIREELQESWTKFLQERKYDIFGTVTFKRPASSAQVATDRIVRALRSFSKGYSIDENGQLVRPGRRHLQWAVNAFFVAEPHLLGSYHVHLLLTCPWGFEASAFCKALWVFMFRRYGRSRFEPVESSVMAQRYVAKYLFKHPGCEYTLIC
jgi:hypothetical protein